MPNGRLYDREGMATMGRQNLETRWVESLLVLHLCIFAMSNKCSKDSSCAHKRLVTNWPHHTIPNDVQYVVGIGTGAGQWAIKFTDSHPDTQVTGTLSNL
jgi:hypothetical protein